MSALLRHLYLPFALAAAAALPLALHLALGGWDDWTAAAERLEAARRHHATAEGLALRLEGYRVYAREAGEFLAAAQNAGVTPPAWTRYEVDFKERPLDVGDLFTFFDNAKHGTGFYFSPRMLEVRSLLGEGIPQQTLAALKQQKVEPGSRVLVSAQGTYLVFNRE